MSYTLLEWSILVISVASVALGLVIGYQAYRGFRRNDSRPMQYLSLGLILLTAIPFTLSFAGTLIIYFQPDLAAFRPEFQLLVRVIMFLGLVFLTISLYEKP